MSFEAALEPPRAHGAPLASGRLRSQPEDFLVEEHLGFAPAGAGPHVLLKVRKRDANTQWVARQLASLCRRRPADVGYAGLKDRHAVAVQWFTVPQSHLTPEDWVRVRSGEFQVLEAYRHARKLPRGALAGNGFVIRVRGVEVEDARLADRLEAIGTRGVPSYFGPQRFGRDAANLKRLRAGAGALAPPQRGFVLSAARSLLFNAVLAERVGEESWDRLEPGDLAGLDGRGSHFPVEAVDDGLAARCARLEIHPTGPLWGSGSPPSAHRVLELERRVAAGFPAACELIVAAGMQQERRSLRLAVRDLRWRRDPETGGCIILEFRLSRGAYATAVLRELFTLEEAYEESST
jgi:tRNA pseudouridine13 synthase